MAHGGTAMRILALQLKRIGDLVLTTPALRALRTRWPEAHIALGVSEGCASLLGAIEPISSGLVFGSGRGWAPWQQVLTGGWDMCFDFTGTDRSAVATALSRAKERTTFSWVQRNRLRALAYRRFVDSTVRERPTVDHYLDLVGEAAGGGEFGPELRLPAAEAALRAMGVTAPFALLHPGTARAEKYWLPERWAQLADHLANVHGLKIVITSGPNADEQAHVAAIQSAVRNSQTTIVLPPDLLSLAALVQRSKLLVSCDTAVVHFAAAFRTPQIALFGPTNPFHWRPRHDRAMVISSTQPDEPLTDFQPRMKGAPMERISTEVVIRATEVLLADQS
jgi:ADP-heptose:LPS heptosyltransferase